MDVGFILDSSGSLRDNYRDEKNFLKAIAGAFDVSQDGAQVGVITFSYYSEHSIKLNAFTDIKKVCHLLEVILLVLAQFRVFGGDIRGKFQRSLCTAEGFSSSNDLRNNTQTQVPRT